jgi:hypothetical protein
MISDSMFTLVLLENDYNKPLTLKLFSLCNTIKYRSIHFTKRITVLHVLTHDPSAAQTIFATGDSLRPSSVVSGAEVGKVSRARILRYARCGRPGRSSNTITLVVILSRIMHYWYALTFYALVD